MKINSAGIALIKEFEGCRLKAYKDAVGVLTIGYGHTSMAGPPLVMPGMTITQQQADDILITDLAKYELAVSKAIKRQPTPNQFAAMVSLCFNVGPGNFRKSTVCRAFNEGSLIRSSNAFLRWNKAGGRVLAGLTRRRLAERDLFLKPIDA